MPRVVIEVSGGCVTRIRADAPDVTVFVLDHDDRKVTPADEEYEPRVELAESIVLPAPHESDAVISQLLVIDAERED